VLNAVLSTVPWTGSQVERRELSISLDDAIKLVRAELVEAERVSHSFLRAENRRRTMETWTSEELKKIARADELEIASLRRDGTLRKPVTIWVVRKGDDLYVRSAYGHTAGWFRGTQVRHEGRIEAGGVKKEVCFAEAEGNVNDAIDTAYRTKMLMWTTGLGSTSVTSGRSSRFSSICFPMP
jgi:hypothetical protein